MYSSFKIAIHVHTYMHRNIISDIMLFYVIGQNNNERQRYGGMVSQIAISEVFKGGSMGKGTTVPGDFDVDLIIFSRCES